MTGSEIFILNTNLLAGAGIEEELFYLLANMKKDILESSRDWMILRSFDSSISFSSSDAYNTTKSLPNNFLRIYAPYDAEGQAQTGVFLVDSAGNKLPLNPIAFAKRFDKKDTDGYYYIDLKNKKIGRTGTVAGTLHLYFIQGTDDIDSGREWEFPSFAHPLLAYEVAIEQKGGIDWDTVNANQVPYNRDTTSNIHSALVMWDARLQQSEIGV